MPLTTPQIKIDSVRRLGGTVQLVGESYTETQTYAWVSDWCHCLQSGVAKRSRAKPVCFTAVLCRRSVAGRLMWHVTLDVDLLEDSAGACAD
jgi:hypothetical protein